MTPLWQILSWEYENGVVFWPGEDGFTMPEKVEYADDRVTTDHLLDWLAEQGGVLHVSYHPSGAAAGWHASYHLDLSGPWIHARSTDCRTAIESVARQVHQAIGGAT